MHDKRTPVAWQILSALRVLALAAVTVTALTLFTLPAGATQVRQVVPLGQAAGIKLFSDGVLVVGTGEIEGKNPARACGLKEGDIITHINSTQVDSIEQVREILQTVGEDAMSIRATRNGKQLQMTAKAVQCSTDGTYKLGAWIRDSMAGIGTLTYYDPESGAFGALGHGVNDVDTSLLLPLESGGLMPVQVSGVKKGQSGQPGELHGNFEVQTEIGTLSANTASGIFGTLTTTPEGTMAVLPVAKRSEIRTGKATILSTVAGDKVEEYEVEILRLFPDSNSDTRDLMLRVTDPRLLEVTGGIVQGMSGSPILQNGKIIGAVTHVLVSDPTRGYGIALEDMLNAAG